MKLKRILASPSCIICLAATLLIVSLFTRWAPLMGPEYALYDRLMKWRPIQDPAHVVIVAIDDASLQELGMWPWPRSIVAEGLRRLTQYGADTVALTTIFPAPSVSPVRTEIEGLIAELQSENRIRQKKANRDVLRKLQGIETQLDDDRYLVDAVRTGHNMLLPFRLVFTPSDNDEDAPLSGLLHINSLPRTNREQPPPASLGTRFRTMLEQLQPRDPEPTAIMETYRDLAGKAAALGAINVASDPDGVVRQIRLLWPYQDRYLPSLALQAVLKSRGVPFRTTALQPGGCPPSGLCIENQAIPTDALYRMRIAYHRPPVHLNRIPFADLVADKVDPAILKDQVAVVGVTATDLAPVYRTPLAESATMPDIMAAAVDTLLRRDHLRRPPWAPLAEGAVLLYFSLFLLLVIPRVKLNIGALILAVFLTTCWGAAILAFLQAGYWFRLFPTLLLCILGFGTIAFRQIAQRLRSENVELNRTLGLSFQTQGMLDMALEKFMQCPVDDKSVRRLLYNLGLDFERKRMPDKALTVYEHILLGGGYRDAKRRCRRLKTVPPTAAVASSEGPVATLKLTDTETRPTFGRYEILEEIGQGAMGTVYLGLDPKINRQVAIKTLGYDSVPAEELEEVKTRFLREAEAAGKLSHPNIVTIYDIGEEHDTAYMAMELLEGSDLTAYCRSDQLKCVADVLDIMAAVTDALGYAHKMGVIHRDIKPANIMRLRDGRVKVTDFGIAKVRDSAKTKTGIVMGTPSYMSPEQVGGKSLDGRSDLFSLGIVFYEMLTGRKPFEGENLATLMYAIAKAPYRPLPEIVPDIPSCCVAIVNKLLNKGVTRRYKSAEQALDDIRLCRSGLS
jgi:CHASE2 domain-containing sensor protein